MKRILPLIALLCVFAAAPAFASWSYDGADGNNIWATDGTWRIKFIKNGSTYYIGGWSNGGATLDLSTVYEDLANESTPHTVPFSSVGNQCFQNNKDVETVILPERCTTVGNNAFNGCTALHTATMPGLTTVNQGAFSGCTSLVNVDCPKLKNISGYSAFNGCTSLVELKVSADMTSFSTDTFRSCTSFTTLYTNDDTKVVGHVQLPLGVTSLGNYNFYQTKIVRIDAPSVTSIGGQSAFSGCTSLTEAHFPKLASMSGTAIFNGCSALQTVEISSALFGTIQNQNFNGCTVLKSVYQSGNEPVEGLVDLPAGVTKLEWACFQNCKAIVNVVAPGLVDIQNRAFTSCTALETVRVSPDLSVLHNNGNNGQAAFYNCSKLIDFYPSTIPNITQLRAGMFQGDAALTNAFDFSGATLTDVNGSSFFSGAKNMPCVKLPASFPKLYQSEFYGMKPGAEIHFAGDIPLKADTTKNDQMYAGKNGAGNRYKIFVDAENFPNWTNNTVGTFTAKTAAMESETDYPGIATLGYLNYASSGQNNWLVQEPFYVDVTFYDEDGTTVLSIEKTLLGTAPAWTNDTPTKASTAQYDYGFAGWSPDGSTVVDLATLRANGPMSFRAIYTPTLRSYDIEWQWFDGTATQVETNTLDYGETPSHEPVERAATTEYTYTFKGWSTDGTTVLDLIPAVTGPATYIAVFEEKDASATVTVRWLDDDGTTLLGTTWPDKNTVAVAPVSPSKEPTVSISYTFVGWSTDGTTVLADLTVGADTDFIAVYESSVRQYEITFADWDDSVILVTNLDYQTTAAGVEAARPTDPTRAATAEYSYAFTGWTPAFAVVSGDATYTAVYSATANEYGATFVDGMDGSTVDGPTTYAYGAEVAVPAAPEHYGYTFAAWNPAVSTMPASNIIYTANYTTNKYTLTFVNGNETTTEKYLYLTPTNAITVPDGAKSASSKASYTFLRWEPELEPVQSNTTYTAMFARTVKVPMKLALRSMDYDKDSGEISIAASVVNGEPGAVTEAGVASVPLSTGETSVTDSTNIVATLSDLNDGKRYEWTIAATQTIYGVTEVAKLYGRAWARREKDWFVSENVSWSDGAYAPGSDSPSGQQVRLDATTTFPTILPRAFPDAVATHGAIVGIAAYQPNAGVAAAYYCWNGSEWVKLVGASPAGGAAVRIFGVVDFARKGGPAVAWYADGLQLTTESGDWEVPLAGGSKLTSFAKDGNFEVSSFSAEYDTGGLGFFLIMR